MSHTYQHINITYDTNSGFDDTEDIYVIYNNSSDYIKVFDKDGDIVTLEGTDSYIYLLLAALQDNIDSEKYNPVKQGYTSKEIGYFELPEKVKENK